MIRNQRRFFKTAWELYQKELSNQSIKPEVSMSDYSGISRQTHGVEKQVNGL